MLALLLYYAPVLIGCAAVWIACDVWERWMEKRTARANELPAPIPAEASGDAAAPGKVIPMRTKLQCATRVTPRAATRATVPTTSAVRVRALRNTRGSRG